MAHPLGFIHGRFQVIHKDHLKYLLAGKSLCDHLVVGITNPTPETIAHEVTNPDRSDPMNNPLTFDERKEMIHAAFIEVGLDEKEFSIVPFPISQPETLEKDAPKDAVYYLTIYDAWGWEKKARLESLGLTTHVMWEKPLAEKGISGTTVRTSIRNGEDWEPLVPKAVAVLIKEWNLQERFNGVSSGS